MFIEGFLARYQILVVLIRDFKSDGLVLKTEQLGLVAHVGEMEPEVALL